MKQHNRTYDLVLLGATGYTGEYTAKSIVEILPVDLRWAVAGRSSSKLEKLVSELNLQEPDRSPPSIELCSLDNDELDALAKKTFILATTIGPYGALGESAFKACADNGTHYLDITGEIPFVARMIKRHEAAAKRTGALMFPQMGLESTPADLVTWSLAKTNREEFGAQTAETIVCLHDISGSPSAGTISSVVGMFTNFTLKELFAATKPFALSPIPNESANRPHKGLLDSLTGVKNVPGLGLLTTYLTGSSDAAIVGRTWGLLASTSSRKDDAYGPNFSYIERMRTSNWVAGILWHWGLLLCNLCLAFFPPSRWLLRFAVGQEGPSESPGKAEKELIEFRGIATPDQTDISGKKAFCRIMFRGSIYRMTGVIIARAAETILHDELDLDGGVYTSALLGQEFADRLIHSGFTLETSVITL